MISTVEQDSGSIMRRVSRLFSDRRGSFSSLRMTAMIDMIFLLLIFFLLTANFRLDEGFLPVELGEVQAAGQRFGRIEPLVISLSAVQDGCAVSIGTGSGVLIRHGAEQVELSSLAEALRGVMADQKRSPKDPVEIICDPQIRWDSLTKVYDLLFGMGISDITFHMTNDYYDAAE
ncbi:MAG: biopolymer transporter ExbD [Planctomycetota bacterium]